MAAALAARAQATVSAAQATRLPALEFEVAAIKLHPHDASMNGGWGFTADSFSATNLTLRTLILYAYSLKVDDQLRGLPKWGDSVHWDIKARVDPETAEALRNLGQEQRTAEMRLLVRNLLATRFGLRVHPETQELPIYDLVMAKNGSRLAVTAASLKKRGWSSGNGRISGKGMDVEALAYSLSTCDDVGRIVLDKTGLTGKYDINLKWTPEGRQETADSGPSIFTALEEQLGLKLVSARGPVDTIVVDRVERPSPN
jgi:uncharacterized protein (TIGR03435 family)